MNKSLSKLNNIQINQRINDKLIILTLTYTLLPPHAYTEMLSSFACVTKAGRQTSNNVGIKVKVFFRDVFSIEKLSRVRVGYHYLVEHIS